MAQNKNNRSSNLQLGQAAEHLVVADLILQGYPAFLADAGCPYDVVVEVNSKLYKIQVKSTSEVKDSKGRGPVYRFQTRRAKGGRERFANDDFDYFAFVALDIKSIAYFGREYMISRITGQVKTLVELKSSLVDYGGRFYSSGSRRNPTWGKLILQNFSKFEPL